MPEMLLTVDDVAKLLQLNPMTIRNYIDAGELSAFRVGRRVRIRQRDLDAFIEAGATTKPTAEEPGPREELGRVLGDTQTALQGGSDADLLAALDELARAVSGLADALRPAGD